MWPRNTCYYLSIFPSSLHLYLTIQAEYIFNTVHINSSYTHYLRLICSYWPTIQHPMSFCNTNQITTNVRYFQNVPKCRIFLNCNAVTFPLVTLVSTTHTFTISTRTVLIIKAYSINKYTVKISNEAHCTKHAIHAIKKECPLNDRDITL